MVTVRFPPQLRRHVHVPAAAEFAGETVAELLEAVERQHPGVRAYLVHENGTLRQHVHIFLDNQFLQDRQSLSDQTTGVREVVVMQALSGG